MCIYIYIFAVGAAANTDSPSEAGPRGVDTSDSTDYNDSSDAVWDVVCTGKKGLCSFTSLLTFVYTTSLSLVFCNVHLFPTFVRKMASPRKKDTVSKAYLLFAVYTYLWIEWSFCHWSIVAIYLAWSDLQTVFLTHVPYLFSLNVYSVLIFVSVMTCCSVRRLALLSGARGGLVIC